MKPVKAYKVFNSDFTCRDFQYEIGKTYKHKGEISLCSEGFHACLQAVDCFNYYSFNPENRIAEVELSGNIINGDDKSVSSVIKIVREIKWEELLTLVNIGKGNSGYRNSGNNNSGNQNSGIKNSGIRNSGNSNSGDSNSGDSNSGNRNSGNRNSGYRNSGNRNSGCSNSGNRNSGIRNSGYRNSGDINSGDRNSGDRNSGYINSGDMNSGDINSGDRNSGDRNSGDSNSGYRNSGNRNSGDWNSNNSESGFLNNTQSSTVRVFTKQISREEWENTRIPSFFYFDITEWVSYSAEEIKEDENKGMIEGYLKTYSYKEAWKQSWNNTTEEDRKSVLNIPGFEWEIFSDITGITKPNNWE